MKYSIILLIAILYLFSSNAAPITNLPGLPYPPNFKQYSGYITVDQARGRSLFYWFVESQRSPSTDPLVLWLTGGPGCSGLIALLSENGPFRPNPKNNSALFYNPSSWNNISNVIYLESPNGVGFSYSNDTSLYNIGDVQTANDTYTFLLNFLNEFPQFKNNPFWVTGESYGGHYVPNIAKRIIEGNEQGGSTQINLKGFQVGNAWTYSAFDNKGAVDMWWTHALIEESTANAIKTSCNLTDIGPLSKRWEYDADACNDAQNLAFQQMGDIDIYDMYIDVCTSSNSESYRFLKQMAKVGSSFHKNILNHLQKRHASKSKREFSPNPPVDPCVDDHLTNYLNIPAVQAAINVPLPFRQSVKWTECSSVVNYSYVDVMSSVIPVYQYLFTKNINILVYSGDVDAIVPYLGTKYWIDSLNLPIVTPWNQWKVDGQVGGYAKKYSRMSFSTVRNAGHMVPGYQPQRSFRLFSSFLNGSTPTD